MTQVPEFIMPKDITHLTDEQFYAFLEGVRERRLKAVKVVKRKAATFAAAGDQSERMQEQLAKHFRLLEKEIKKLDELIEKAEGRWRSIQSLRIALGMDVIGEENERDENE